MSYTANHMDEKEELPEQSKEIRIPYYKVLTDIEEMVKMHYSLPRRDVTDYIFKQTIKKMRKSLGDPFKKEMEKDAYFNQRMNLIGNVRRATISFYMTGKYHFHRNGLPDNLAVRHMIDRMFPVVVDRIGLVSDDCKLEMERYCTSQAEDIDYKMLRGLATQIFSVRFRFGKYEHEICPVIDGNIPNKDGSVNGLTVSDIYDFFDEDKRELEKSRKLREQEVAQAMKLVQENLTEINFEKMLYVENSKQQTRMLLERIDQICVSAMDVRNEEIPQQDHVAQQLLQIEGALEKVVDSQEKKKINQGKYENSPMMVNTITRDNKNRLMMNLPVPGQIVRQNTWETDRNLFNALEDSLGNIFDRYSHLDRVKSPVSKDRDKGNKKKK